MRTLSIAILRIYQIFLSPYLPRSCRFYPTCSSYAIKALEVHGFFYSMYLIIHRILRCHPFCQGGYDPVPQNSLQKEE